MNPYYWSNLLQSQLANLLCCIKDLYTKAQECSAYAASSSSNDDRYEEDDNGNEDDNKDNEDDKEDNRDHGNGGNEDFNEVIDNNVNVPPKNPCAKCDSSFDKWSSLVQHYHSRIALLSAIHRFWRWLTLIL
jgi:hypothetical protein